MYCRLPTDKKYCVTARKNKNFSHDTEWTFFFLSFCITRMSMCLFIFWLIMCVGHSCACMRTRGLSGTWMKNLLFCFCPGGQAIRLDRRCGGGGGSSHGWGQEWQSSLCYPTAGARTRTVWAALRPLRPSFHSKYIVFRITLFCKLLRLIWAFCVKGKRKW